MQDPGPEFVQELADETLEALVETMLLAAVADGELSDAERRHFAQAVEALTQGRLGGSAFDELLERLAAERGSAGGATRLAALRERLPTEQLRRVALVLASDMAAADGVLHPAERELLHELAAAFELDPAEAIEPWQQGDPDR